MKKEIGVYKLTSPFGKVYIGQSRNIHARLSSYKKNPEGSAGNQTKLLNAFRKYGSVNFIYEILVIFDDEPTKDELDLCETALIEELQAVKLGYNCKTSGIGGRLSSEVKQKIGNFFRGKPLSEEHKQKLHESNLGKLPPPHSEETLQKMSNSMKGKNTGPQSLEHRQKLSEARGKWRLTEEQKKKINEERKPVSEETRQKLSKLGLGRVCTEETRKKMSDAQIGRFVPSPTKETIEKRAIKCRGQKRSDEVKQKMKDSWKKKREEKLSKNSAEISSILLEGESIP